jgi:hypothetical protein
MTSIIFTRLDLDWSAQPNVPLPEVRTSGCALELRLLLTAPQHAGQESNAVKLTFGNCRAWRWGDVNDEGWYRGQCRYGRLAPAWGHFYEMSGDVMLRDQPEDWQAMPEPGSGDRHYLFYLRDETFECIAENWQLTPIKARAHVSSTEGGLIGLSGVDYLG